MKKELKIDLRSPLNEFDTENQTYGCRANNPDICKYCMTPNICAFSREDGLCKHPSNKWKKQFIQLIKEKENKAMKGARKN